MKLSLRITIVFFVFITGFAHSADAQQKKKKPNIIFILTDDLGYGDLGAFYQQQRAEKKDKSEPWMFTPHLDQLAQEGAKFTHQYSPAPVCAPSRASLLSGHTQGHANVRNNQFDKALEDNYNMASVLKEAGYATAVIGKWGLQGSDLWEEGGDAWPAHPLNRGFDYFFGYMRHIDGHEHYPKESIYREVKEVWENKENIIDKLDKSYTTDLWTAVAKKWIVDHTQENSEDPFFIYLSYDTPHAVLELPTQPYPTGGGLNGGLQWTGKAGQVINTASGTPDSWTHPDYENARYDHDNNPNTPEVAWPEVYQRYATSVRRIDSGVGDLIRLLKDLNIDSNTLVVFTSDNGPSLESYLPEEYEPNYPTFFNSFGPFDGIKRDSWEGGLRVPSIAWWPSQIKEGNTIEEPSALYDWLPTFSEAAGLPAPARVDGVSLLPVLTDKREQKESLIYVEYFEGGKTPDFEKFSANHRNRKRNQMQMIRMGDYSGVRYDIKEHTDDFEIYDVVNDPQQINNLANADDMLALQQQMKDKVLQVRRTDTSANRPYDDELIPASVVKGKVQKGLNWKIYDGQFPWIPNTSSLNAVQEGTLEKGTDIPKVNKDQLIVYQGYIEIPKDGVYTFHLNNKGKTLVRLHQILLFDKDYAHEEIDEVQAMSINLKAGLHPFTFYNIPQNGNEELKLQWEGPGVEKSLIPAGVFRY